MKDLHIFAIVMALIAIVFAIRQIVAFSDICVVASIFSVGIAKYDRKGDVKKES